jgi:biotin operon repressor
MSWRRGKLDAWSQAHVPILLKLLGDGKVWPLDKLEKKLSACNYRVRKVVTAARNAGHDIWYVEKEGYQLKSASEEAHRYKHRGDGLT